MTYFCKSDPFEVLWEEVERYETSVQEKIDRCKSLKDDIDGFISAYEDMEDEVEDFYLFLERCLYGHWNELAGMENVKSMLRTEIRGIKKFIKISSLSPDQWNLKFRRCCIH